MRGAPIHLARLCLFSALALSSLIISVSQATAETKFPQKYGAWSVECKPRATNPENPCVASQMISAAGTQQVVLGVMVAPTPGEALPHIVFRLSSGASQEAGAAVKIDDQEPYSIAISQCDNLVCEVRSLMPEAMLVQMRTGKELRFAFFIGAKQITYPVSLNGFDQAFSALKKPAE
jgi:invasion protein IalB